MFLSNNKFFNQRYSDTNFINEIKLLIKINKEDINNKVYFLKYQCKKKVNHVSVNLNELNELNAELCINKIKCEFNNYFIPEKEGIYDIEIKFNTDLTDCSYMFAGCDNIIDINFISIDTKNVSDMKYMFDGCKNLRTINLFSFDTRNVTDMSGMFRDCTNLEELDLSSFDIKNVKKIKGIFSKSEKLLEKNLSLFEKFDQVDLITNN